MADKLWGGRFTEPTDALVERLNASVDFDQRLYREDLTGSIAHVRMLAHAKIIAAQDATDIEAGLRAIRDRIEADDFEWRADREDVHLNIEAVLTEQLGPTAGRLHTGRSRNDQVALDLRLFLREQFLDRAMDCLTMVDALLEQAKGKEGLVLPGYTHLQRAQPVSIAHHLHAYAAMFLRDVQRLLDAHDRANECPLGAGALAGTPHPIDREFVAKQLGFPAVTANSLDTVSDRDAGVEFLSTATLCMNHLSRLSEELVVWMSQEFGFVTLPDSYCTGSSIMPQKKNPDVSELVRGKSGRVTGALVSLLMTLKGLPLAYNKDMQEDKEPIFDANRTLSDCLQATARILTGVTFHADRMTEALQAGFVMATDVADALVEAGVPFRDAHHRVGTLVQTCVKNQTTLEALSDEEWHSVVPELDQATRNKVLDPKTSLARRTQIGGPAPEQVRNAQESHQAKADSLRERIEQSRANTELIVWMRG